MYDSTAAAKTLKPIWNVDEGWALFAGPLSFNAAHQHSVPVYIAGLYEPFLLRIENRPWTVCRTAVIPAGVTYALDIRGNPLAVLYLEPSVAGVDALRPLIPSADQVAGCSISKANGTPLLRELYEDRSGMSWVSEAADNLVSFAKPRAVRDFDPRITRVTQRMRHRYDDLRPIDDIARSVGLSTSRFQHVFAREVGVSYQRYRCWHRLRAAIREVSKGANLTSAAQSTGFYDQAHFAHHFRKAFGASASPTLLQLRK
ncbi:helix-turn-helix transcriptional regulator [Hyphomicrobium sp. ghe19]|uniref:helix-turn-helix transcriptional regulator n=1 Tax=Hyphomicrobium sp. ghe19 TaxID=2682968 RepID=UPI00136780AC|nr:hypothetical protein HYPP_03240 [Hyphomicrobium sp. ghe19]